MVEQTEQKNWRKSHNQRSENSGRNLLSGLKFVFKLVLILVFLPSGCWHLQANDSSHIQYQLYSSSYCWILPTTAYPKGLSVVAGCSTAQPGLQFQVLGRKETNNFQAKCVNGNRRKGILNIHLNIRSLNHTQGFWTKKPDQAAQPKYILSVWVWTEKSWW